MTANGAVIDTCVHHQWASYGEVLEYLPTEWRRYVGTPGSLPGGAGARKFFPLFGYPNPAGDDLADAEPTDGSPAGSSYELLEAQALSGSVERALLMHNTRTMFVSATPNPYLATVACSALNDWTVDRWLSQDSRLYGVVLAPTQLPLDAAAEIRRAGSDGRMAGVLVAALGTGKLLGHPLHDPIFEAAQELDLPLIIHRGGDAVPETPTGVAGGPPFTFAEYSTLAPMVLVSQVLSMISNGVFAKYPNLRVLVVGGGVSWIPGVIRRVELAWRALRREVPWVRESPTEYFHRHIRVSTYGLERDGGRELVQKMTELSPELAQLLVFGSGYPAWDTTTVEELREVFPIDWHTRLMFDNADNWLRWTRGRAPIPAPAPEPSVRP